MTRGDPLMSFSPIRYYLSGKPDPDPDASQIHILVVLPDDPVSPSSIFADGGATIAWMHALQANQITDNLPRLGNLDKTIRSALPVKIATPHGLYTKWLGKMTLANPELMAKIFEINDVTPCMDLLIRFGGQIVDPPRAGNSEMSYVSRWDGPIRCVLDTVLPDGKGDRDSCQLTSTGLCRPDYLFILDSVCIFRGEEKARGVPIEVPRRKLTDKLIWTYGDVPYLFAYAAAGDTLSLYAISRTSDSQVGAKHLATFNLEDVEERLRLLLATLNISLLLRSLAKLCPDSGRDEYRMFTRPGGVVIYLEPFRVIKAFQDRHLFDEAQRRATRVYSILLQHDVPNADRMSFADPSAKRLVFAPRGQEKKPTNVADCVPGSEGCAGGVGTASCVILDASRHTLVQCDETGG